MNNYICSGGGGFVEVPEQSHGPRAAVRGLAGGHPAHHVQLQARRRQVRPLLAHSQGRGVRPQGE